MAARNPQKSAPTEPFWRTVSLAEMTESQWESLCDGCARCCLNKLQYEDTGEIAWTDVACKLLDGDTCRCGDYPNRHARGAATIRTATRACPIVSR